MADNRLAITATLNVGTSVGELNKKIRELSKHPSLQKIKLKVDIDNKVLQTLQQFNANLNKINQSMQTQGRANDQVSKSLNNVTGSVKSDTQAIKENTDALARNEELRKKIKTSIITDENGQDGKRVTTDTTTGNRFDSTTKSVTVDYNASGQETSRMQNPTVQLLNPEAYREAEKEFQRFSDTTKQRFKEINKQIGNNNKLTQNLKKEFNDLNVLSSKTDFKTFDSKLKELENYAKQTSQGFREMDDALRNVGKRTKDDQLKVDQKTAEAAQKAQLKAYEDRIALLDRQAKIEKGYIHDIDRAHYEAFQEKEKRETHFGNKLVQDRVRAYEQAIDEDKKFNQQRFVNEQKFARMQQDTFNKIETARMKFGHHKGVNENLDRILYGTQQLSVRTKDWDQHLRNANAQIGKATTGLKAMRVESLTIAEGLRTAMVNEMPPSMVTC